MRAPMERPEHVGGVLVVYGAAGKAVYATAGWDSLPSMANPDDLTRVRRLVSPEKMSRTARRMAA